MKLTHRFNAIQSNAKGYFVATDKMILKPIWTGKRTRITKTILKKNNIGGVTILIINLQ